MILNSKSHHQVDFESKDLIQSFKTKNKVAILNQNHYFKSYSKHNPFYLHRSNNNIFSLKIFFSLLLFHRNQQLLHQLGLHLQIDNILLYNKTYLYHYLLLTPIVNSPISYHFVSCFCDQHKVNWLPALESTIYPSLLTLFQRLEKGSFACTILTLSFGLKS